MTANPPRCANCNGDYSRDHVWNVKKKSQVGQCKKPPIGETTFYRDASVSVTAGKGKVA